MNSPHTNSDLDTRTEIRASTDLKTIVQVKESESETWKEVTEVTTVSRSGAGFCLKRRCEVGRLVTLVMPLQRELRAYDHDSELYPVLGLVQYCNTAHIDGTVLFNVGVAFVGKTVPESFKSDPQQTYQISGMGESGLWLINPTKTPFKVRRNQRFSIPIVMTVSLLKGKNREDVKETSVTKNISMTGISIRCSLDTNVGDRVKVASEAQDFYALAVVRNRKSIVGEPDVLNLEFIDERFPMEKILFSQGHLVAA